MIEERREGKYDWGRTKLYDLTSISPAAKWMPLFETLVAKAMPHFMTQLATLARVLRGIATGANDFFTLTQLEVEAYKIEPEYLKPVVACARYLKGYDFAKTDWERLRGKGKKVYLLWCFSDPPSRALGLAGLAEARLA